jgi:hypothetical protein
MEHVEGLVAEVTPLLKMTGQPDSGVLISVGVKLAARVNALKGLSGVQKRDLVVVVLCRGLEKLKSDGSLTAERYAQLQVVVKEAVPAAIDAAIDAARGKLNLKKIKPSVLLRYCSCFASTAVSVLSSAGVISNEDAKKAELVVRQVETVGGKVAEKADIVFEMKQNEEGVAVPVKVSGEEEMKA